MDKKTESEKEKPALLVGAVIGSAFSPHEFRIGNYVTSKSWGGSHKIQGIEVLEDRIDFKVKGYVHSLIEGQYFDLDKIQITAELLLKVGFIEDKRFANIQYRIDEEQYHSLNIYNANDFWCPIFRCESQKQVFENYGIKYLHQLQNIYYIYSGRELSLS